MSSKKQATQISINMDAIKTAIEGVAIIEPKVFKDARGYFFESFSQREFEEKVRRICKTLCLQVV